MFVGLYIPSFFYLVFKYKDIPEHVLVCPNVKGMSKISDYFDYYSTLLPFSLMSTGIVLITLGNFNISFPFYGVFFSVIGILIFGAIINLKSIFYNRGKYETYNNLVKANDIFANYISLNRTRESSFAIKQFTKYFLRTVDSIDLYLDKGIKIDHLKSEENIPVKQALIYYLPIYLKYGNEAEINSFENNLNSIIKLVDEKNTMNSLDIINVVYTIYQDIIKFLKQHNYVVPKNILYLNLRHNIKSCLENIIMLLMMIFILIGLIKDIIPYEHINSYLAKLFGLAVISIPLFEILLKYYKSLKE
jgi:hypothetical protein